MRSFASLCIGLIVATFAAMVWTDGRLKAAGRERDAAIAAEQIAQAKYAEQVVASEAVRDTVIREVTKTRTLRDSVLLRLTDTAYIQEFVYQTDTLVIACERCAASLLALRVASDSVIRAKDLRIASLRPRLRDRCGVVFGYGLSFARDRTVTAGPNVTAGCKVWP